MADLIKIEDITIRKIDKNQYVSGQITIDVIEEIAKYGITLIINNRPDNEEVDQVRSEELKLKAKSLGIKGIYVMRKVDLEWAIPSKLTKVGPCE